MKKYFILTLAVIAVITSCSRNPTPGINKQDMLRTGKWMIESGTVVMKLPSGRDTTVNYMNFLPACRKDDYMVFHSGIEAAIFTAGIKCNPGDPDSAMFNWYFTNNETVLSMYHGFDFIYGITDSVLPFVFDTLSHTPLVLDTIHGVLDTEFSYTRVVPILDTIWNLKFDSVNLKYNDLYNAKILEFSQSSFTLNFSVYSTYPDTTGHHTGYFIRTDATPVDTIDFPPVLKKDTLKYTIKYKNF